MPQRKLLNCLNRQTLSIVLETIVFQYVHHKKNHPIISTTIDILKCHFKKDSDEFWYFLTFVKINSVRFWHFLSSFRKTLCQCNGHFGPFITISTNHKISDQLKLKVRLSQKQIMVSSILALVKSVNLRYITVGRLDDDTIVPPSDGPIFILINWE